MRLKAACAQGHQTGSSLSNRRTRKVMRTAVRIEEDPGSGRRFAQVELGEAERVEIKGARIGVGAGPAAGHDEDRVEQADRIEHAEGDGEHDHGREQRQRDPPECPPAINAVKLGRFIEMGRDGGKSRQQDHEHEGRPLPDIGKDEGNEVPWRSG